MGSGWAHAACHHREVHAWRASCLGGDRGRGHEANHVQHGGRRDRCRCWRERADSEAGRPSGADPGLPDGGRAPPQPLPERQAERGKRRESPLTGIMHLQAMSFSVRSTRHALGQAGQIKFLDHVIRCMVSDVSYSGARLTVAPQIEIPDRFNLEIEGGNRSLSAPLFGGRARGSAFALPRSSQIKSVRAIETEATCQSSSA